MSAQPLSDKPESNAVNAKDEEYVVIGGKSDYPLVNIPYLDCRRSKTTQAFQHLAGRAGSIEGIEMDPGRALLEQFPALIHRVHHPDPLNLL